MKDKENSTNKEKRFIIKFGVVKTLRLIVNGEYFTFRETAKLHQKTFETIDEAREFLESATEWEINNDKKSIKSLLININLITYPMVWVEKDE